MEKIFKYNITHEFAGSTIDDFLRHTGFSRHLITHLKRTDIGIAINGNLAFTDYKLKYSDCLTIKIIDDRPKYFIEPYDFSLEIVFEDDDILVINKPCDMSVHPSMGNYQTTLANALSHYYNNPSFVFRCINRLDRDTTGLLIVAKHALSGAILCQMIKKRQIKRRYLAICSGLIKENITITAPIARLDDSTIERTVDFKKGQYAVTHATPISSTQNHTLVKLSLETGRTHQIRIHMKYIGYPLIGDFLYNKDFRHIKRQALHSHSLEFVHPITNQIMSFHSPMPHDMCQALKGKIVAHEN